MTDYPPPPANVPAQPMPMGGNPEEKNSLGVWALVLGILTLCCGIFSGIPAIILGVMSRKAQEEGKATNGNLGTIGMVIAIVLIVLNLIGVIVSFATGTFDAIYG